jgi:hypothetical protein
MCTLKVKSLSSWDSRTVNAILSTGFKVYSQAVKIISDKAAKLQLVNPHQVAGHYKHASMGDCITYSTLPSTISVLGKSVNHKAVDDLCSLNTRGHPEKFKTLEQGITTFFAKGHSYGVLIQNSLTRSIFKEVVLDKDGRNIATVFGIFDSQSIATSNETAALYYFKSLEQLVLFINVNWRSVNTELEFDLYALEMEIVENAGNLPHQPVENIGNNAIDSDELMMTVL